MDGKGRATDNAITERFFRNLKLNGKKYTMNLIPNQKKFTGQ